LSSGTESLNRKKYQGAAWFQGEQGAAQFQGVEVQKCKYNKYLSIEVVYYGIISSLNPSFLLISI